MCVCCSTGMLEPSYISINVCICRNIIWLWNGCYPSLFPHLSMEFISIIPFCLLYWFQKASRQPKLLKYERKWWIWFLYKRGGKFRMRCKSGFARFILLACSRLYVERKNSWKRLSCWEHFHGDWWEEEAASLWMSTNFVKPRKSVSVLIFSVFHVDFLFFIIVFVVFD